MRARAERVPGTARAADPHGPVDRVPFHHKDPFDRLLVAQALIEQIPRCHGSRGRGIGSLKSSSCDNDGYSGAFALPSLPTRCSAQGDRVSYAKVPASEDISSYS